MDLRAKLVAGVAFVGLFAGAAPYAAAQQITSTVRGVVTSPAGEPVPGALVTVTDTRTGRSRTTSTNATGVYNVSNLEVGGPYTVLVDTNDFQDTRIDDLRISLSDTTQ
ncbi:MAG: carboxypeptidase-like regulatory domain-containing protein [Maricaulaceae bacterium]